MKSYQDRPMSSEFKVRTHRGTKTVRFDSPDHVAAMGYNMREYFRRQDRGEVRAGEAIEAER